MAQQPAAAVKTKAFDESEFWSREGYPLNLRTEPEKHQENYSCGQCKKLARHAVEISCDVHLEDPNFNPSPYCEGMYVCFSFFLFFRETKNTASHPSPLASSTAKRKL